MTQPVRVGLVGAGPWARLAHAPLLSGGPETQLVGIWARRSEAAEELAAKHGSRAVGTYDELLDSCEAVAFAVPPEVQGRMATEAAKAGKHLLLDKPVADSVEAAQLLADAVAEAGVSTMVLLTYQFTEALRRFLPQARALKPSGAAHENISGGFLAGPFSQSPWRHEGGVLPDVGPHVVDLFTTILGPAVGGEVQTCQGLVRLGLRHESGAFSHAVLSAHHTGAGAHSLRVYAPGGVLDCDWDVPDEDRWGTVRREFAASVRTGAPHACDVHRGLELQRVLNRAIAGG
ncbi:MAG: Gfo/Idh/MocA family protein [Mycobacteriales bacterium]